MPDDKFSGKGGDEDKFTGKGNEDKFSGKGDGGGAGSFLFPGGGFGWAIVAFVGPVALDVGRLAVQAVGGQVAAGSQAASKSLVDIGVIAQLRYRQRAMQTADLQKEVAASRQRIEQLRNAAVRYPRSLPAAAATAAYRSRPRSRKRSRKRPPTRK